MPKRKSVPQALEQLVDEARRNEGGTPPRKHHLVPASYLRRWAESDQIRVTVIDESHSFRTAPAKAARETDFYRLEHPDVDPNELPPLLFETMLSKVEGNAKTVIDGLIAHGRLDRIAPEQAALFAWHVALTLTRGKAFRAEQEEMLTDFYRLRYAKVSDQGIHAQLRRAGIDATPEEVARHRLFLDELQAGDIRVQRPDAASVALSAQMAQPLGERLFDRVWVVHRTPPILVTCDEPVVILGGPGSPRAERSGVGVAGVVLYPLSPSELLVLFHPDMRPEGRPVLDRAETLDINREIIASGSRWAFERPTRPVTLGLRVPPAPEKPFMREGPLPQVEGAEGELYRTYKPTRWRDDGTAPPWPVERWWVGWQAREFPRVSNLQPGDKVAISKPRAGGRRNKGSR